MTDQPVVNERIAARRAEVRAGRRRRRLRRTLVVVGLAVVAAGLIALERSSLVALVEVEVVGLERLDHDEVLAAAEVRPGMSVLRIRRGAVRERVEALPLVEAARVERRGALGLRIEVDEAAPAVTATFGERSVLVGTDGRVLGRGKAPGTPEVVLSGPAPAPGESVAAMPSLAAAHAVVLGLPGPLGALVDHVRAVAADDVRLVLADGVVVRWGDASRAQEKARALGVVLEDLAGRSVTTIDVRAPKAPTVTP